MKKPESILAGVRRQLALRKGKWKAVARDSGVAYDTLTKIAQGRVDPGVSKVQLLVDYFRQHPVDAKGRPRVPRLPEGSGSTGAVPTSA